MDFSFFDPSIDHTHAEASNYRCLLGCNHSHFSYAAVAPRMKMSVAVIDEHNLVNFNCYFGALFFHAASRFAQRLTA